MIMRGICLTVIMAACTPSTTQRQTVDSVTESKVPQQKGLDQVVDVGSSVQPNALVGTEAKRELVAMSASWAVIEEVKTAQVVVELTPKKGWYIYWLNPGEAGLSTSFELKQKQRVLVSRVRMPVPKRKVSEGDIVSFAFDGPTRFFVAAEELKNTESVTVTAGWLACAEVCIKGSKTIELSALSSRKEQPDELMVTKQKEAWAALPIRRTLEWKKNQQMLVYEASTDAKLALFPHVELFRRLDGHASPYCHNNRC